MNRIAFVLTRMASASLLSACFLLGMSSCGKSSPFFFHCPVLRKGFLCDTFLREGETAH